MHLGAETDVKQVIEKKSHKERLISSTALPLNITIHIHKHMNKRCHDKTRHILLRKI